MSPGSMSFCSASSRVSFASVIVWSAFRTMVRSRVMTALIAVMIVLVTLDRRLRAKLITRMLLAVGTPMLMIITVSAGTERVVLLAISIKTMRFSGVGSGTTIT